MNNTRFLQRCIIHSLYRNQRVISSPSIRLRDGHIFKQFFTPSLQCFSFNDIRLHSTSFQRNEIKDVYEKSINYLDEANKMTSSRECAVLIDEWYKYLSREIETSTAFDPYKYLTGGFIESERQEI